MSFAPSTGYCFLETFRPGPQQRLEWAVFSTYSLDLVALVALLMELADVEGESLDAGDVPFIQAIESLENKVAVLCQHGRISFPKTSAHRILVLLDRFLRKVEYDERERSWHAKIGVAKYIRFDATSGDLSSEWRLWLGSRNLTQNTDWEAGIMFVGRRARSRERPSDISGLQSALQSLLTRAWQSSKVANEMASMSQLIWRAPSGVTLETIALRQDGGGSILVEPPIGARFRSILAVAPFVNMTGLKAIVNLPVATGRDIERTIVTTRTQLSRPSLVASADIAGVTLRLFGSPSEEGATTLSALQALAVDGGPQSDPTLQTGDGIEGNSVAGEEGIHAKLILGRSVRKGANALWIGSANLTRRALSGRNAEVVARLRIPDEIAEGLEKFLRSGRKYVPEEDFLEETESDRAQRELNEQRNTLIADVAFTLMPSGESSLLVATRAPFDRGTGFTLSAALLSMPHGTRLWPEGATEIVLAENLPVMRWTDMVVFELHQVSSGASACWIQQVQTKGFAADVRRNRDNEAIVDYLGKERFVLWLQAIAAGKPGVSDRTWDGRHRTTGLPKHKRPGVFGVTLESMLANWARNPDALSAETKAAISARIVILRCSLGQSGAMPEAERISALKSLEQFHAAWGILEKAAARGAR